MPDAAVRDQDAPMVAVVDAVEGERAERAEGRDLAARLGQALAVIGGHRDRADRVDQHVHLDARAAALGQRLRHIVGGLPVLEHVLGVVDRLARGPDGLELRREDLVAVQQDVDAVAAHEGASV